MTRDRGFERSPGPMTDTSAPAVPAGTSVPLGPSTAVSPPDKPRYDRSIVEGPLRPAVWKIAWPTMLTNIIGGLQGIVDHVLVGHLVGFTGNAAIGVALADLHRRHRLHHLAVHRHERARRALRRRRRGGQGRPHGLPGVPHRDRASRSSSWRRSATSLSPSLLDLVNAAPDGEGGGAAVPAHHVPLQQRHAGVLHARAARCARPATRGRR